MKIQWRPRRTPHYGGHIERLIGTQMGALHLLPGSSSSNIAERGEYDPKLHAALTLRDLERHIALEIVGSYHQSIHSGLRPTSMRARINSRLKIQFIYEIDRGAAPALRSGSSSSVPCQRCASSIRLGGCRRGVKPISNSG